MTDWTIATEFPVLDGESVYANAPMLMIRSCGSHGSRSRGARIHLTSTRLAMLKTAKHQPSGEPWPCSESESIRLLRQLMKSKTPLPKEEME